MTGRRGPRAEIAAGLVVLGMATVPALATPPPEWELDWFRAINHLPDSLYRPVWTVMQLGALGAAPATAVAALALGKRSLAGRLLIGGTAAWVAAKGVKLVVGRARPAAYVGDIRIRGAENSGLGFPSGHAGVVTALVGAALLPAPLKTRLALTGLAAGVGAARMYVGAHLPLDVVAGAALGVTIDGALRLRRTYP